LYGETQENEKKKKVKINSKNIGGGKKTRPIKDATPSFITIYCPNQSNTTIEL